MIWRLKLRLKILSGKFPLLGAVLRIMGFQRLGDMESVSYASGIFSRHLRNLAAAEAPEVATLPDDLLAHANMVRACAAARELQRETCLEIGPGGSLSSALLAHASGFGKSVLIDEDDQARAGMETYALMGAHLRRLGYPLPDITPGDDREAMLQKLAARYCTRGFECLSEIADASIDFSFSQAVLEHIPINQVRPWLRQLKRIGKPGGISSHVIDLRDHLGGSLNHLRFPSARWERDDIRDSGVYTNRLRKSQWVTLFQEEAIAFRIRGQTEFPRLPLDRRLLDPEFRDLADEDLRVRGFEVVFFWT